MASSDTERVESYARDLDTRLDGDWATKPSVGGETLMVCPVCFTLLPQYCYLKGTYIGNIKEQHTIWHREQGM